MDNKVITVSGFAFENPTVGEEALKEQEAIEYVSNQLNFNDTKSLLTLYNQMVRRRMFHTEVGYAYLKSIQDYLMKTDIDPAQIESIPVNTDYSSGGENTISPNKEAANKGGKGNADDNANNDIKLRQREIKLKNMLKRYQRLTVTFITIAVVLAATVVAMFVIANTSNNPTILNYEEVLQNKYAAWEQDLEAREAALKNKN